MANRCALGFAFGAALGCASSGAQALTLDIALDASGFAGKAGPEETGEVPPQDVVTASFTIDSDGPRDVPDRVEEASNGDGPTYEVRHVYTTPVAAQIEIAGYSYPLSDLAVYVGFVNEKLDMILVSGRQGDVWPPAHGTSAGTDDFLLFVDWDSAAGTADEPRFWYGTAETASNFRAGQLRIAISLDGGPPVEHTALHLHPIEGSLACAAARAKSGSRLDPGVEPGSALCNVSGAQAARSGAPSALRHVRVSPPSDGRPSLGGTTHVRTALGSLSLDVRKLEGRLLAATTGASAALEPPAAAPGDSFDCAGAKVDPRTGRRGTLKRVLVIDAGGGVARYDVRKPKRLCVASAGGQDEWLLCYRARPSRGSARSAPTAVWVAHDLGVERVKVGRPNELCLPASLEE